MNAARPSISPGILKGFRAFSQWYLARHFGAVRLAQPVPLFAMDAPVIIYLNHSAWWDPLICLLLAHKCFPGWKHFAPMEARQLDRYGIFRRIGMFGVEQGTRRGAVEFLRTAGELLAEPRTMLWITPQARFADVRERPLRFAGGLERLAQNFPDAIFCPLALEYVFWNERLPEALLRFGVPGRGEVTSEMETRLGEAMAALAALSQARDKNPFVSLLKGKSGVWWGYDWWRRASAALRGEAFRAEHGL